MSNVPEYPVIMQYADETDRATPEGYSWLKLAEMPVSLFAGLAMGGGSPGAIALVCQRCGSFVALAAVHEAWHRAASQAAAS